MIIGANLEVFHAYLFGSVKYLDLLFVLMIVDIVTGVAKAYKEGKLRSRTAWFGYARKLGIFGAIILANVIDVVLDLKGSVAFVTVLFYIANEGLSILENLTQLGVKVPSFIKDKLLVIQQEKGDKE
ncbi:holin [Bacillus infantis]|uniref:Holin n=2 Tax=Bacillus infantis TaxID=324767 RepID=A0A5D4RB43_9BACI|nr:phage holin family protein [Bacillus infantis]TYS46772.1 holin [Bacillus infantis]